ncbi:MAG: ATP-dependent zinc protease [Ilumatobacter fluminis]|uniref:ATP-dependent zinc protease family protein n=1 Tax=Ilumatobacter fluminis TaxID=467091 RepID=UPI0032EC4437
MSESSAQLAVAGWREWIGLPDLDVSWVKAKLDTGARSSAIHAWDIEPFDRDGAEWVRFQLHPWQMSDLDAVDVELPVVDRRTIRSSTGHEEERYVVRTKIRVLDLDLTADLTLTNRDEMGFRMLVGREALRGSILVDPGRSYIGPRPSRATRKRNLQEVD